MCYGFPWRLCLGLVFRHLGQPPLVGYLAAGFLLNAFGQHGNELLEQVAHAGDAVRCCSVFGLKLRIRAWRGPRSGVVDCCICWWAARAAGSEALAVLDLPVWQRLLLVTTLGFSSALLAARSWKKRPSCAPFMAGWPSAS